MFLELTIALIFITVAVLIIDKIQVVLNNRIEVFKQNEEGEKGGLFSVNEERQSLIEESNESGMVIKGVAVSGRERIIKMEGRIRMLDKLVFAFNVTFFTLLTI